MHSIVTRRKSIIALASARIVAFLAVLGPGFITANVDNDPGGILTYSQAGAKFGYSLLWTMIPTTIALIVVQEMCARMGAVTGKGLSDLIREEFGFRVTFLMMVPLAAAFVWLIVVKGSYTTVYKVFLLASFFYVAYIIAGVLAGPQWVHALY